MLDRPEEARERLHAVAEDKDSLLQESAGYYEAKALLRLGRPVDATAALQAALALHGDREKEISDLLEAIGK